MMRKTFYGQKNASGGSGSGDGKAGGKAGEATELSADQVKAMVGEAVKSALAGLPVPPTAEVIGKQIEEAFTKHMAGAGGKAGDGKAGDGKGSDTALSKETVKAMLDEVTKSILDGTRAGAKNLPDNGRAFNNGEVEIPFRLCKGNLPVHMLQLLNVVMRRDENHGLSGDAVANGQKIGDAMILDMKSYGVKALTPSTAADWIPRDLSAELLRRMYLSSAIAQSFMSAEVNMPTDPYEWPLGKNVGDFYLDSIPGSGSDATNSDPELGKFTLTTKTFRGMRQVTDNAEEDSIIAILPELERDLAESAARALESALINGDTTSTHQDTDVTDSKDARKSWKGFRKLALAGNVKVDFSTGGLTRANFVAQKKIMKRWGTRSKDLLWIWGPQADATLSGLDDFALAYARGGATTFGDGAPVPAPWGGMAAVSDAAREDLNASGVYDGSTTTKGAIIAVYKPAFRMGFRRRFTVEMSRNARAGLWEVIASFRRAFAPIETPSTALPLVSIGYNYTV